MPDERQVEVRVVPRAEAPAPLVDVRPRGSTVRDCAYCRDAIGAHQDVALCPACSSTLHVDCRAVLDRCPTVGCQGLVGRPVDRLLQGPPRTLDHDGHLALGAFRVGPVVGAVWLCAFLVSSLGVPDLASVGEALRSLLLLVGFGAGGGIVAGAVVGAVVDVVGVRTEPSRWAGALVSLTVLAAALVGALLASWTGGTVLAVLALVVALRAFGLPWPLRA